MAVLASGMPVSIDVRLILGFFGLVLAVEGLVVAFFLRKAWDLELQLREAVRRFAEKSGDIMRSYR